MDEKMKRVDGGMDRIKRAGGQHRKFKNFHALSLTHFCSAPPPPMRAKSKELR